MEFLIANIKPLFQIIVSIIGFILSIWGLNRKRWAIFAIGIGFILAVFISTIYEDPQFGTLVTSLSTIALAIVAIFSFRESMQLRKQNQERDEQNRKEHLLGEIINWAVDIIDVDFGKGTSFAQGQITPDDPQDKLKYEYVKISKRLFEYQALDTRSRYIKQIVKSFSPDLQKSILNVISQMNKIRRELPKRIDNISDEKISESTEKTAHELREASIKLIELAADKMTGR